jgi:hypothetical protein
MSGPKIASDKGSYVDFGIASNKSRPSGRRNAATWTDMNDKVWIYGGRGIDPISGTIGICFN